MKKVVVGLCLATTTVALAACSKADKEQESQESSSAVEQVVESSSESKSKQENTKVTPADYARIPEQESVSEDVKKGIKEYVGVYRGTEKVEENGIITNVSYELEITEDGVFNSYVESSLADSSQDVGGELYVNTKGELDVVKSVGKLGTGIMNMSYGQAEFTSSTDLHRSYVDETGELLPIYGGNSLRSKASIPSGEFFLADGKVKFGNVYEQESALTLEKQKEASQNLRYTTYQISEYSRPISIDTGTCQFDSLNEFVQAIGMRVDKFSDIQKRYRIVDDLTSLKGYYTEDNQEITGIKWALGDMTGDKEIFYVYDGQKVYELSENNKGQKIARESSRVEVHDFINYTNIY